MVKMLSVLVAAAAWVRGCFEFVQYFPEACKMGDWSKMTTVTVLMLVASSGWFLVIAIVMWGCELPGRKKLRAVESQSDVVAKKIKSAKTIRVFCSDSGSCRSFIHNRVSSLQEGTTIKVMMRTDSTPERNSHLKKVADKWRKDISGRGVTGEISAVDWCPVMFRGWVFEKSAIIGWYHRTAGVTVGQEYKALLIEDEATVQGLTATFEAVFNEGVKL